MAAILSLIELKKVSLNGLT